MNATLSNLLTQQSLLANEGVLRLGTFALALGLIALAERLRPFRSDAGAAPGFAVTARQRANLALALIDTALLRFAFPLLAVAWAVEVERRGGGLFGVLDAPVWLVALLAVLVFDLAIYWQHRLMHRIGWLWPLHRVHHSDIAFDVTTGVRFHPAEIALSMGLKLGLVTLLGPPAVAVVVFELWLSLGSLFTHANFALPARWERVLRVLVVTPSMHRIHHSTLREETDSNYGFNLSVWDRVFGSYRNASRRPPRTMPLGLPMWRDPATLGLRALLLQPLKKAAAPSSNPEPHDA